MGAISPTLERVIREVGDSASPAYQNLRAVVEESPVLMQQMNDAIAKGHLRHIALMPAGESAGASYSPDTQTINLKRSDLLEPKQRNVLTFLMGHEIQHGINRERTRQGLEQFDLNVLRILESGQPVHDYSPALDQMLSINRTDEATAHIAGWNALVSRMKHGNPEADLSDMEKVAAEVGYVNDFVERKEIAGREMLVAKDGFTIDADLSITPNSRNIEAAGKHYFDKAPQKTWLGYRGNSDYTNYYAAGLVSSVCQYEILNPAFAGKVQMDMRGLRLQETLLEQNGISLGSPAARCAYQDSNAPDVAGHFDHTADSHRHMPINGLPAPTRLPPAMVRGAVGVQLDHPMHPGHTLFGQAQAGVHLLDAKVGRTSDQRSNQLAAALVVTARTNGMDRIDHVVLGTDTSKVFAVQGALDSALKRVAAVPTVEALDTPIAQSTSAWQQASERIDQQAQERFLDQQHSANRRQGPVMRP